MLDPLLRRTKDVVLAPLTQTPLRHLHPTVITVIAVLVGLAAAGVASQELYGWGLGLWILNRFLDGLDGTVARSQGKQSDLGGYLDIVLDLVAYAGIPIGLVMAQPSLELYLALAILLASFYVNTGAWMYLAGLIEKRQREGICDPTSSESLTSLIMPPALIEGTETIVLYTLFFLFPQRLLLLFYVMATLVGVSIFQRMIWAIQNLSREN